MTAMVTALVAWVLLASGTAGFAAGTGGGVDAKYPDVLHILQNVTQPQLDYLRNIIIQSAEERAHYFVARFREALTLNETERESLLAAARVEGVVTSDRHSSRDDCQVEESIQDKIRRILREGLPSEGIPPLDPLRVDELPDINLHLVDVLELHATLSNLSFDGLSGFKDDETLVYEVGIIPPSVTSNVSFDVLFPRLHLLTQYNASGYTEAGLDIGGEGPINIDIFQFKVKGDITVRATLFGMTVEPCEINLSSRSMNLKIEGLSGGDHLSDLVGETITEFVNEYAWSLIFERVSPIIENGVCTQLRSMTAADWIAILRKIGIIEFSAVSRLQFVSLDEARIATSKSAT